MSHHWSDNVHTTAFTPRDYQVELLAAAREKNIIVCLGHNSSKEFIALKLLHEKGHELRQQHKNSLYICQNGESTYNLVFHLTDLQVINLNLLKRSSIDWTKVLRENQILILNPELCLDALICSYIDLKNINLMIVEDCHRNYGKKELDDIFKYYEGSEDRPFVLGLAGPLHSAGCVPGRLSVELECLEKALSCRAETASDIVTVLRYCAKPREIILQCAPPTECEVTRFLRELIITKQSFLAEHRFDPSEIYDDEFLEELQAIPDPKREPLDYLDQYLQVLDEFGPWCANRAAFILLNQIDKSKIKTPYERHFLLLCMISTTFVQIRSYCEYVFQQLPNEKARIERYSSPKILRVLEILRLFKPEPKAATQDALPSNPKWLKTTKSALTTLDTLDFKNLANNLEKVEKNDQINGQSFGPLKDGIEKILTNTLEQRTYNGATKHRNYLGSPLRQNRQKYRNNNSRGGVNGAPSHRQRQYWHNQNDPDALCGLIFCNSKFLTKILHNLFSEMSKNDPDLRYLSVQFTIDRTADPLTETKEAEVEHRKQEEVLKRFRMHECNLLIGTSVLEEGMDLPKCNLVIRWDPPTTYRSYVQCKGRARAANAYHIIMVTPKIKRTQVSYLESLSAQSHRLICPPSQEFVKEMENLKVELDAAAQKETVLVPETSPEDEEIEEIMNVDNSKALVPYTGTNDDLQKIYRKSPIEIENYVDDQKEVLETFEKYVCVSDEKQMNGHHNEADVSEDDDDDEDNAEEIFKQDLVLMEEYTEEMVKRLAQYMEIEKMLMKKCENFEPGESELQYADTFRTCIEPYKPLANIPDAPSVNIHTAVALVNKYCAKLPSDTFTKLTPLWRCARTERKGVEMFQYTIRLPINSPLKQDILGLPMPTRILARRIAALITCRVLHQSGELDDSLQPIGKEGFRATEPDWENFELEKNDQDIVYDNLEPRPGTTKRRQYYYKRIASVFSDCRPKCGVSAYLYQIKMTLECPIPEEQNTRGRKIYPPEDSPQGFGILTLKQIPKISSFPIFTRSGEVKVALELCQTNITLNDHQLNRINVFLNYTFTNVLRLQKYLMLFDAEAIDNSFFIVPTVKSEDLSINVDWNFLETISHNYNRMPKPIPENIRKHEEFDPNRFKDAVVMPWYRNQDQPQYFYVAEICYHLSPESSFPGDSYKTFEEYYFRKYDINIQNSKQPLLDVDHTSARLNFLTPRYVNRKGVALPTSSEETKRAKRENLEQKQILVPELCTIHPFPASLWRAAVCLPCILYRINALLLADEIRKQVSFDLGLGKMDLDDDQFEWPTLDFGWSLAEVLKKSREQKALATAKADENDLVDASKKDNEKNDSKTCDVDEEEDDSKTANDILEEADKKLKSESVMEIGTWSNEMAENMKMTYDSDDDDWGILPPNVKMCSTSKTNIRYGSPTSWNVHPTNPTTHFTDPQYFSDSDQSFDSDDGYDIGSDISDDDSKNGCLKIEFKSDNLAEAIETEEDIQKRQRQLEIINNINANEKSYQSTKNIGSGYDCFCDEQIDANGDAKYDENMEHHERQFNKSIVNFQNEIRTSGMLVGYNEKLNISKKSAEHVTAAEANDVCKLFKLIPFLKKSAIKNYLQKKRSGEQETSNKITLNDLYEFNRMWFEKCKEEMYTIEGTGDVFDRFNDFDKLQLVDRSKQISINYEELSRNKVLKRIRNNAIADLSLVTTVSTSENGCFSFDEQPDLRDHPGPSPSIILQALTMSNANDGINLERLETIGDSFLKYAITTYLYCTYENVHEGKLSHLRSKQVSNLNLYRLGRKKMFGESMIATKFEPHDNWLPPCYYVPKELEKALIEARIPACHWNLADLPNIKELSSEEICKLVKFKAEALGLLIDEEEPIKDEYQLVSTANSTNQNPDYFPCFIPYNLVTQHSIPDKSVADCVEALIGAYLIECGLRGALLFMAWLGIRVLPYNEQIYNKADERVTGSTQPYERDGKMYQTIYGHWAPPKSPLLLHSPNPHDSLDKLLDGYCVFEEAIGYKFKDRSYLLQAMTHASYSPNRLTDCYQRLEFLGDAVLDYLITRHLYEDPRQHSPGALTDLRSALVNNTIFASLAVRHGFHKYFRHLSPGLNEVIDRFVRIQHENGHCISEEFYLISEEECDEAEDVEVPKALGDVFESVAGAIFLDSNMSLDTVWLVYSNMMRPEIELFSNSVPKSPIRELLELEPETAKFSKPEKLADGRRVRVTVEVFGKGTYRGIGRNYRIAKCTAAKCALRQLKKQGLINRKH